MPAPTSPPVKPLVSVITPLWNEEDVLPGLVKALTACFQDESVRWQWIAVDDGSVDATNEMVANAMTGFASAKLITLSRNFGQQPAYRAGLDHADGDAVIFLDADLQDPPAQIPEMIAKWREGARLVVGCRRSRPERGVRGLLFNMFHSMFFHLTRGAMPRNSGTFGLMDRVIVDRLRAMPEVNLFLPALRRWVGSKQEIVWYDRQERDGKPRQTYSKLFQYAWDGITSFSEAPLKYISMAGLVICVLSALYALALLGIKLGQWAGFFSTLNVPGFTTLAVAVISLGGVQLLALGVIGEYLARVYREVKGRPLYIVERVSGKDEGPA